MADPNPYADVLPAQSSGTQTTVLSPPQQARMATPYSDVLPSQVEPVKPVVSIPQQQQLHASKNVNLLGDNFKLGTAALSQGLNGWGLFTGVMTPETAKANVENHDYLQAQDEIEANNHILWQMGNMKIGDSDLAGGILARNVPALMGAGAAISAGFLVAGPPGALAGGALFFGAQFGGQTMYDLSQRKVDPNIARVAALGASVAGVVLGFAGVGQAGKAVTQASIPMLESVAFKDAVGQTVGRIAQSAGIQLTVQARASLIDSGIKYIATKASDGSTRYTMGDAADDFGNAMVQAALTAPVIGSGSEALGHVIKTIDRHTEEVKAKIIAKENPLVEQQPKTDTESPTPASPTSPLEGEVEKTESRSKAEIKRDEAREDLSSQIKKSDKAIVRHKADIADIERRMAIEDARQQQEKSDRFVDTMLGKEKKTALDVGYKRQLKVQRLEVAKEELRSEQENNKALRDNAKEVEETHRKLEMKRLTDIVEATKSPRQSGAPNSRMERGTDVQQVLNRVRHYVENPDDVATTLAEFEKGTKDNDVSEDLQKDYDAAKFVGDIRKKSSKDLRELMLQIKIAYEGGRRGRLQQLADKAEARLKRKERFVEGLQGDKPVESDVNPPSKIQSAVRPTNYVSPYAGNFFWNYKDKWKFVLHNSKKRDALVEEIGVRDIADEVDGNIKSNIETLYGHLSEETGKSRAEVDELLRLGAKKTIHLDVPGKTSEITLNQAMDKLAQLHDPQARRAFIEGNLTDAMEKELLKEVDPDVRESILENQADAVERDITEKLNAENPAYAVMWKGFVATYKDMYPALAKAYKEAYGEELPNNPDYSGYLLHEKNVGKMGEDAFELRMQQLRTVTQSGTIAKARQLYARTGDKSPLAFEDIKAKFLRGNTQTEHWIGFQEFSREVLGPLLRDPKITRILERKYGKAMLKAMRDDARHILYGNADIKSAWAQFLNRWVLKNTTMFMLSGKPIMLFKHLMSVWAALDYLPAQELAAGIWEFYSDYTKNYKAMSKTKQFTNRHGHSDISTAASAEIPEEQLHPVWATLDHIMMSPTIYGIKATDAAILYAARKYYMSKGGGSKTEVEALQRGGEVVHNSQVSSALDITSNLARSDLGATVMRFQGQVQRLTNEATIAFDYAINNPSPETIGYAIKTALVSGLLMTIFEGTNAAYNYATAPDEKARQRALYDGELAVALSIVPFFNTVGVKQATEWAITEGLINPKIEAENKAAQESGFMNPDIKTKMPAPHTDTLVGSVAAIHGKFIQDMAKAADDPKWRDEHVLTLIIDVNNELALNPLTNGRPFVYLRSPLNTIKRALPKPTKEGRLNP